jgi:hypothetical protein
MIYVSKESMSYSFYAGAAKKDLIICQQKDIFLPTSMKRP